MCMLWFAPEPAEIFKTSEEWDNQILARDPELLVRKLIDISVTP